MNCCRVDDEGVEIWERGRGWDRGGGGEIMLNRSRRVVEEVNEEEEIDLGQTRCGNVYGGH